jgi:hypothetical protein
MAWSIFMKTTHMLHAELEELQKRYWCCFNNWDCNEDLEKIQHEIEELKYKLSQEPSKSLEFPESIARLSVA